MPGVREVLHLKYEPGPSHPQIAAAPGIGHGTAGAHLKRASRPAGHDADTSGFPPSLKEPLQGREERVATSGHPAPPRQPRVFGIRRNQCSACLGIGVRHASESASITNDRQMDPLSRPSGHVRYRELESRNTSPDATGYLTTGSRGRHAPGEDDSRAARDSDEGEFFFPADSDS